MIKKPRGTTGAFLVAGSRWGPVSYGEPLRLNRQLVPLFRNNETAERFSWSLQTGYGRDIIIIAPSLSMKEWSRSTNFDALVPKTRT